MDKTDLFQYLIKTPANTNIAVIDGIVNDISEKEFSYSTIDVRFTNNSSTDNLFVISPTITGNGTYVYLEANSIRPNASKKITMVGDSSLTGLNYFLGLSSGAEAEITIDEQVITFTTRSEVLGLYRDGFDFGDESHTVEVIEKQTD